VRPLGADAEASSFAAALSNELFAWSEPTELVVVTVRLAGGRRRRWLVPQPDWPLTVGASVRLAGAWHSARQVVSVDDGLTVESTPLEAAESLEFVRQ